MSVPAEDVSARAAALLRGEVLTPPPGLVLTAMGAVRSDVRPGRWIPLPTPGGAVIAEVALLALVRRVLDELDDVSPQRLRLDVVGRRIVLRASIAVAYGSEVRAVADLARQHVLARVLALLGLDLAAVDLEVADVFEAT